MSGCGDRCDGLSCGILQLLDFQLLNCDFLATDTPESHCFYQVTLVQDSLAF